MGGVADPAVWLKKIGVHGVVQGVGFRPFSRRGRICGRLKLTSVAFFARIPLA